jgi:hypothetical protein
MLVETSLRCAQDDILIDYRLFLIILRLPRRAHNDNFNRFLGPSTTLGAGFFRSGLALRPSLRVCARIFCKLICLDCEIYLD